MTVSDYMRGEMFAEETGDGLHALITISHDNLAQPIRVVDNTEQVTSRSNDFEGYPFELVLPSDDPDQPMKGRLSIDNVSREITQAVRSIDSAAELLIEAVRISDPNEVELSLPVLRLRNVRADVGVVTGDLFAKNLQEEPYPAYTFNPADFPGLF